ncbi:T3SS effector pentapeptide repeat protein EspX6 [Escherichia coli O157:H7]|uniref:T3SS effector pentapeptide repeat protein EspX6 n=3 Tax=Escherichia coli TaxID=562 RepID=UPI000450C8A7|nr:T3SS effector pentapeptide repeat protein EspX6 [Escherichia coli]MED7361023.1 T3SS effector pentapeptide repeat protein EspX6 [Escherichia coli O157]EEQ5422510.1 T3SS effector pentapeptide repeat protein EspX6 [Escherichia coli]EFA8374325.1 T3SS effector pentapeptide repeat protein EspX6 [Escherichia coli O157:H7]EFA8506469.1 T3SS effector pentapeptide repeat protein EspX6 [Escherichia coli O157:H7]EFJ5041148.1 T3SS effector pentapeptide repeat protein EspX6 [Escherichia coli]
MGSLFNIYKDIFPTLGMYSGLKACHEKNNLPFDINTEIETIQKQINYDINHLNDGLIKRVLNLFIHLISNPDNLELTLNRYSSTTEQIIGRTKRNGLHEFDDGDLKIIFNRQDDNESVLTVKDKDKDKDKDISHHCNVKTEQLQQFIKIMEQKAQLPIYIDKNNLKESIFSVLHNDPQQVDKDQHLPCEKFLKHACKSSNSFEVKLDATHQYQHLNNFMISFDPVENQLTIRDNNNKTETFSFTNLQWENLLQYYKENHQQPNIAGSRNLTDNIDKIKNTISTSEIIECASPEIRSSVLNDLYSIANFLPDNNLTPNESWKRFCETCERFYVAQKSITGDKSERLTRKLSISDAGITMTFKIGDVVINTISTAIPEDATGQRCIEGLNLAEMDLTDIDLSKMALRNVNFNGSILRNAKFSGTICEGVDFTDCDLRNAEFENASLENNDFRKVRHLTYVNFKNANLRNSNFNGKVLTGVTFTGSDLSNAYLEHIDFTTVILYETSKIPGIPGTPQIPGTPKVILTGAILNYSDLSGKDLSEYNLTGILCMYTNFSNANLTNCKISNANFSNAKFYNTNCTGANCSNILFDYAWFDNTIFIKTLFKNTCFYNVRAKNVYLEGAYLNNDNIVNQANNSTEKQSIDSTDKQANDSTVQQSIDSTVQQANDSTDKQANDSTDKQANDNIDKQVNDSTDKQAKNSTEQQDSNSFNQARLKKEVNRRFSIPGLTSYQPTYIVEE